MVTWDGSVIRRTPRLTLRTFTLDDLADFHALNADPEVYRWLGGSALTRAGSDEIAAWANTCWEAEQLGLLAVHRTDDRAFLGMCGLHRQESAPDEVEIAWRLGSQHWGHGYATEAASEWVAYGFGVLNLPVIISMTDHPNVRSQAVMTRIGMTFRNESRIVDDGQEFDVAVYALTADRWREGQQREPDPR